MDNKFFTRYWLLFLVLLPGFTSLYAQNVKTCSPADTLLAINYTAKADTFVKYDFYDSAAVYYRKAGDIYEERSLWRKCVRSINNACLALISNSKYDTAKYYLSYSSVIAEKNFSENTPYDLYCLYEINVNYGRLYNSLESHDEAISYFNKCIEIINKIEEFGLTVNFDKLSVYNYLGHIFDTKSDFSQAYHYYNECLVLSKDLYGEKGLNVAILMRNIGGLFYDHDDYSKAHGYYLKAQNIFRDNNIETIETGYLFNDLGLIFQETDNIDEAIKYYQDAKAVYTKFLNKEAFMFGELYHNFAEVFSRKHEFKKALDYYNKAIKIFVRHACEVSGYVAHEYNSIGILYYRQNELDSANHYFKQSLRYRRKIYGDIHPGVAESYYNIGIVYFKKSD